jgi:hypothetical protein
VTDERWKHDDPDDTPHARIKNIDRVRVVVT